MLAAEPEVQAAAAVEVTAALRGAVPTADDVRYGTRFASVLLHNVIGRGRLHDECLVFRYACGQNPTMILMPARAWANKMLQLAAHSSYCFADCHKQRRLAGRSGIQLSSSALWAA